MTPLLIRSSPAEAFRTMHGVITPPSHRPTILAGEHFGDGPVPPAGTITVEEAENHVQLRTLSQMKPSFRNKRIFV